MSQGDKDRPWWLQVQGVPPGRQRRLRERWPDWDQLSPEQRVERSRNSFRESLARHPWVVAILLVIMAWLNVTGMVHGGDRLSTNLAGGVYGIVTSVVGFLLMAWLSREFWRGRSGS